MRSGHALALALLAAAVLMPPRADAALGALAASVDADQAHMKATREAKAQGLYTVHEMTLPSGTVVREFVETAGGRVFAVAWRGPFMPDLQQLLGEHFDTFAQEAARGGVGRGAVAVDKPAVVVHSGGQMRSFAGFAYIPGQLPQGVQVATLR
jgi:hypothetical protein